MIDQNENGMSMTKVWRNVIRHWSETVPIMMNKFDHRIDLPNFKSRDDFSFSFGNPFGMIKEKLLYSTQVRCSLVNSCNQQYKKKKKKTNWYEKLMKDFVIDFCLWDGQDE